jgi:copper transport protein
MTLLTIVIVCLILILGTRTTYAHAVLAESVPADGAVLAAPPGEVMLRFNEPVAPVMLRVLDIDAKPIADASQARVDNERITIPLPRDLPSATYVVSYRVISIDAHPISGAIVFTVGEGARPVRGEGARSQDRTALVAAIAMRALFLAALLIATGGVLALWRVAGFDPALAGRIRLVLMASAIAALAFGLSLLGVTGCYLSGGSLAGLGEVATWRVALASSLAQSLAVAATGLVLILVALPRLEHGSNRLVGVAGGLIAIAALAFSGHAATTEPRWLMRWSVPLHALCAAFWLGSLPVLAAALRREPAERARRLVDRFSAHGIAAVAVILALGAVLAVVQVAHLAMLWQTAYGAALSGKVAAVALLLGVAAHNKWRRTPRIAADATAPAALTRAISLEYALFAVVLAFTATLGQIEPPRTTVARDTSAIAGGQADFVASLREAGYQVTLSVAPARAGHNALAVEVADAGGGAVTPQEIALEMSLPAAGIEPLRRRAVRDASGRFIHHSNDLAVAGRWRIDVHVLIDDFTRKTVTFAVPIR